MTVVGPIQQAIFFYVWRLTHMNSIVGLTFEMARFQQFSFLPLYVLLARAIRQFVLFATHDLFRLLLVCIFAGFLYLNLGQPGLRLGWEQIGLLLYTLILIAH